MTGSDIDAMVSVLHGLFPKSDWTPQMLVLFREDAFKIDISQEQAIAVVKQYRRDSRGRSPILKDLLTRLKAARGEAIARKTSEVSRNEPTKFSDTLRRIHRLGDMDSESILYQYHSILAEKKCGVSFVSGVECGPIATREEAMSDAWGGYVGDLCREGCNPKRAKELATRAFGKPSQEQEAWSTRMQS